MSDADVKANIAVSTDVEQATQKTQKSIVSMQKQIEDIQKKFSTAGKDIFLGFFAPMAILQTVMGFISDKIAKAKQDAADGLDLLAKGESAFATTEEAKTAAFFKRRAEIEKEKELITAGRKEITEKLLTSPEGQGLILPREAQDKLKAGGTISGISEMKSVQDAAMEFFKNSPEGRRILAETQIGGTGKEFKAPEGFSNVVGVGANPTLEAMSKQLEIQQAMLDELRYLTGETKTTGTDFTKGAASESPASPSTPKNYMPLGF